jgi:hypothetical protein
MMKFFVTFGQKYRREPHPYGGHPDGWFELEAESQGEAREKLCAVIGTTWAFIYTEPVFEDSKGLYPRGLLKEI